MLPYDEPQPSTSNESCVNPTCDLLPEIACEEEVHADDQRSSVITADHLNSESISKSTQVDHEHVYGSINRYKDDNEVIKFYAGFESYRKFQIVYSTLSLMAHKIKYYGNSVINLNTEDQFFLTLMELRQNKCNFELSRFFNVSETTVSNIFITWINFIYQLWSKINIWPSKELTQYYMPESF